MSPHGARTRSARRVGFRFDGRAFIGQEGDTLASALIANGISVVARSFKYHRPRGVIGWGVHETNALVTLGDGADRMPNQLATRVPLVDGLVARAQNAWPSVRFDLGAVNDRLAPLLGAGFYYKTFMWPDWHLFEPMIRHAAGLGAAPALPSPVQPAAATRFCDVLVVGGGPAGLMAARAAAEAGADTVLAEMEPRLGGRLAWAELAIEGLPAAAWADGALRDLNVQALLSTTVVTWQEGNALLAVEGAPGMRQRLWRLRPRAVVLATGAIERPMLFAGNDRPGVMLADAVAAYARVHGVAAGRRAVFVTTNDLAYPAALAAAGAGIDVAAVLDARPQGGGELAARARAAGLAVIDGAHPVAVRGRARASALDFLTPDGPRRLACDLVGMSGGWTPALQLFAQAGGGLGWEEAIGAFVPGAALTGAAVAGAAAGHLGLAAALASGAAAGADAAVGCGYGAAAPSPPAVSAPPLAHPHPQGLPAGIDPKRCFVDFQTDVTLADLELAVRENYRSVEHVKRYTTLGMGVDQGKLSSMTGIAALAGILGRTPPEVGVTRFRPPAVPVALDLVAAAHGRGELHRPRRLMPAHGWHAANGALFEDWGWERPSAYPRPGEDLDAAARREALAVRTAVGLVEGSPLGKFELKGPEAGEFLDRIYVGRMSNLGVGRVRYGLMLNENGTILDDGVCARLGDDHFLVFASSGHAARVFRHLDAYHQLEWPLDFVMQDVGEQWAILTVAGPRAPDLLRRLGAEAAAALPHMRWSPAEVGGIPVRAFRVSFSGELSFELNVAADHAVALAEMLAAAGAEFGLAPYGIEALEILRIEKGYIHVGQDTDAETQPADIGFAAMAAAKPGDHVGRRSLSRPASAAPGRRQLVGLQPLDPGDAIPCGAHLVADRPGGTAGFVTSSAFSPALGHWVALGLVADGASRIGQEVDLFSLGRFVRARLTPPCHFDPAGDRLK